MVLADNAPGFDRGVADMFFFAGGRPKPGSPFRGTQSPPGSVPPDVTMPDANPGTFYSALSNVDFEIGSGNSGAVAIRFHVAQHSYLAHINFHLGSGLAGIHDVGNEAEDLHFYGGRYGILTRKPSPAWQFTLLDSTFEGQREAAIRENEAGLTIVHDSFKSVPTAIEIDRGYSDELWIKDSRFENISGPVLIISNEDSRMTEINAEHLLCSGAPVFVRFRESRKEVKAQSKSYEVKTFTHGLVLPAEASSGSVPTQFTTQALNTLPVESKNVIRSVPAVTEWTNLRTLGAKGDNKNDNTAVIQKAVLEHRIVYVPMGRYVITDTIKLRPDSILIALHQDQTQFIVPDQTPAFQGVGAPGRFC